MARLDLTPAPFNVNAERGKTWKMVITVRDSAGTLISLVGYSCSWALAARPGATPLLTAGQGNHISLGGAQGTITLDLPAEVTAGVPVGSYVHEFTLTQPDGAVPPFIQGQWRVTGKVA